jgi:hypothetical protein
LELLEQTAADLEGHSTPSAKNQYHREADESQVLLKIKMPPPFS